MEQVISQILLTWGPFGIIVIAAGWVLYNQLKSDWKTKNKTGKNGLITVLDTLSDKVDLVNEKIEMVNTRVNDMNDRFEERADDLENRIKMQSAQFIKDIEKREQKKREEHSKQMNDLLILGPKLHKILVEYIYKVNADHIFLGSFHNGSNSISGVPYYKFDIIAERFIPVEHGFNKEIANIYKDEDVLRHNKLPGLLFKNKYLSFNQDNFETLCDLDNVLYQRFKTRRVNQFAVCILVDNNNQPSGFVGCARYNVGKDIDIDKLKICADTLEGIYHVNEEN